MLAIVWIAIVWTASTLIMILVIYPITMRISTDVNRSPEAELVGLAISVSPVLVGLATVIIVCLSLGYLLHIADLVNRAMVKVAVND